MTKLQRIILTSTPIRFIRNKSKKLVLPGFENLALYDVFHFFMSRLKNVGLIERAAAISFNLIMAIPATTIFLCTLVPYLPISKQFINGLFLFVYDITPNQEARKLITRFLDDFFNKPQTGLLSIGFLLAIFYSSNAMMGIIRTFDRSLIEKQKSNFIHLRLRAISLTTVIIVFFIGTILILLGQGVLFSYMMEWLKISNVYVQKLIQNIRWIVIVFLFLYSVAIIYKFAPSIHKRWRLITPGALFATFLMILTTSVFSYWAQNISNYNKFYGPIGTLLILMLLIQINSLMLLIGFELNVSITQLKRKSEESMPPASI